MQNKCCSINYLLNGFLCLVIVVTHINMYWNSRMGDDSLWCVSWKSATFILHVNFKIKWPSFKSTRAIETNLVSKYAQLNCAIGIKLLCLMGNTFLTFLNSNHLFRLIVTFCAGFNCWNVPICMQRRFID